MITGWRTLRFVSILQTALFCGTGHAWAQEPASANQPRTNADVRRPPAGRPDRPLRPGERGPAGLQRRGMGMLEEAFPPLPGPNPFRPLPADWGPIVEGEAAQLLEFARKNVPKLSERLEQIRLRDPADFDKRLDEAAPRLRMLKRLFAANPRIAASVVRHIDNIELVRRAMRLWLNAEDEPVRRTRIENEIRRRFSDLVDIERELAETRAAEIRTNREQILADEVARLTVPGVRLDPEPRDIRWFVEAYQVAANDADRAAAKEDLRDLLSILLDDQVEILTERAEDFARDKEKIIERRLEGFRRRATEGPADGLRPGAEPRSAPSPASRP